VTRAYFVTAAAEGDADDQEWRRKQRRRFL
jgi:hypothetical protein